jgi:hypothetical protein
MSRGRPRGEPTTQHSIRLTDAEKDVLVQIAARTGQDSIVGAIHVLIASSGFRPTITQPEPALTNPAEAALQLANELKGERS